MVKIAVVYYCFTRIIWYRGRMGKPCDIATCRISTSIDPVLDLAIAMIWWYWGDRTRRAYGGFLEWGGPKNKWTQKEVDPKISGLYWKSQWNRWFTGTFMETSIRIPRQVFGHPCEWHAEIMMAMGDHHFCMGHKSNRLCNGMVIIYIFWLSSLQMIWTSQAKNNAVDVHPMHRIR